MMRKLFLFLLGLLLWGAAYSTPASILQYKVEPTQEQKAEFLRKASKDPELYSYNPMHIGNVWWYITDWLNPDEPHYPPHKGREIVDSTFIEGSKYYRFSPHYGDLQDFWLRNIGDLTMLWDHHDLYDDLPAIDDIRLNVYPNPSQQGFDISYNIPIKYDESRLTIFNLRGQKVLQADVRGSGVYHWDGRNTMQNQLAKGVYLIKISTSLGQSTSKKLTLK